MDNDAPRLNPNLTTEEVTKLSFDPAVELGQPATLEAAVAERNAWCETAARHCRNEEYLRGQRDAFLVAALSNPAVAEVADRVVGTEWRRLLDNG